MARTDFLRWLPTDVTCKIIDLLPILDRGRLEAVSKGLRNISRMYIHAVKFDVSTRKRKEGALGWLTTQGNTDCFMDRLKSVTLISLGYQSGLLAQLGDQYLSRLSNLTSLHLWDEIADDGIQLTRNELKSIALLTKLKSVAVMLDAYSFRDFIKFRIEETDRFSLVEFSTLTDLESLSLSACLDRYEMEPQLELSSKLTGLSQLTKLHVGPNILVGMSDFQTCPAAQFHMLSSIICRLIIDEAETHMNKLLPLMPMAPAPTSLDVTSDHFPANVPTTLERLAWRSYLSDNSWASLNPLHFAAYTRLTLLDLSLSPIGDIDLLGVTQLTALETLSLPVRVPCVDISTDGICLLQAYTHMLRLKTLSLVVRLDVMPWKSIGLHSLLDSRRGESMTALQNLHIRSIGIIQLDARFQGIPNLRNLTLDELAIMTTIQSDTLTSLNISGRLGCSSIPSICADFMQNLPSLVELRWCLIQVDKKDSNWLVSSLISLTGLQQLHIMFDRHGDSTHEDEKTAIFRGLLPRLHTLTKLHTLEIVDDSQTLGLHLKRAMIPSVRRLGIYCGDLKLCISCFANTAVIAVFKTDCVCADKLREVIRDRPEVHITQQRLGNLPDNIFERHEYHMIRYNACIETWVPEAVELGNALCMYLQRES